MNLNWPKEASSFGGHPPLDQARPTFYFKYTLLNWMRDELWLTRTRRRVTFFHLLCVLIPAAGIGTGIALGQVAHSLLKGIIWCAIGIAIGGVIAWLLPKLLWNMLHLFARKGWFLERQHPHATPMMTLEEFAARGKIVMRKWQRLQLVSLLIWVPAGCAGWLLLPDLGDESKHQFWAVLAVFGLLAVVVGVLILSGRIYKRLVRELGLQCPTCGRAIAGAQDFHGFCRHCGAKVIQG